MIGGPHAGALPIPTLETSQADFVAIGEGEESACAIVDLVVNGDDPAHIPYRASEAFRKHRETTKKRDMSEYTYDNYTQKFDESVGVG